MQRQYSLLGVLRQNEWPRKVYPLKSHLPHPSINFKRSVIIYGGGGVGSKVGGGVGIFLRLRDRESKKLGNHNMVCKGFKDANLQHVPPVMNNDPFLNSAAGMGIGFECKEQACIDRH